MELEVTYDVMADISSEIKSTLSELQKTMSAIENMILSLSGDWQGDAETACAANIIAVKKRFAILEKFISAIAEDVSLFAVKYHDFDFMLASEFNKI